MNNMPVPAIMEAIITHLSEAYDGPPVEKETWFLDPVPGTGILGILAQVSAEEASRSVDGSGAPGSTIASNVEHLRWTLVNDNANIRGEAINTNWSESWQINGADEAAWQRLRGELRAEYERLREAIRQKPDLPGEHLTWMIAIVTHSAFHLGLLRQMIERVKG